MQTVLTIITCTNNISKVIYRTKGCYGIYRPSNVVARLINVIETVAMYITGLYHDECAVTKQPIYNDLGKLADILTINVCQSNALIIERRTRSILLQLRRTMDSFVTKDSKLRLSVRQLPPPLHKLLSLFVEDGQCQFAAQVLLNQFLP